MLEILVLAQIEDNVINEIETFVKTVLASDEMVKEKDFQSLVSIFGYLFASQPKLFQFLTGDKIVLRTIKQVI